ncbi:hypothetical protein [Streptomyces sp. NPDC046887]|uniref:hypothetical protein n=1 Tax=Streptomyces sp. NPDC046887 TaxID=3155472 RepID=UPI0033F22AEF
MADERNAWLDHDVAERLLRGDRVGLPTPVDPVDPGDSGTSAERARRLAEALAAVRAAHAPRPTPGRELPGEDAALAAFRAGRKTTAGSEAARGAELGPVRLGAGAGARRPSARRPGWARGMRWGLAASVAGLAVGGVAVAAGTGVLPVLGKGAEPLPAATVSAEPAPSDSATPVRPTETGTAQPVDPEVPQAPERRRPPVSSPPGPSTGSQERDPGRPRPGGTGPADPVPERTEEDKEPEGTEPGEGGSEQPKPSVGANWLERTVQACRDYRSGKLDNGRKAALESDARGRANIERFCDRLLDGPTGDGGGAGSGLPGSGLPGSGWGHGDDGKGKGGKGDGGGRGDAPTRGREGSVARPFISPRPAAPALTSALS